MRKPNVMLVFTATFLWRHTAHVQCQFYRFLRWFTV